MKEQTWQERFDQRLLIVCDAYEQAADNNFDKLAIWEKERADIKQFISDLISQTREETIRECKNEDFSDGYHTFKELYEFRKVYNACLFNEWYKQGKFEVHKSKKHFNGEECFGGGWFVVVAILPTGQISNHYELKDWDLFEVEEVEMAKYEFDGHTSQDVLMRLKYEIKILNKLKK